MPKCPSCNGDTHVISLNGMPLTLTHTEEHAKHLRHCIKMASREFVDRPIQGRSYGTQKEWEESLTVVEVVEVHHSDPRQPSQFSHQTSVP